MAIEIFIDVIGRDSALDPEYTMGAGPVTQIQSWRSTARMDRAGNFSFLVAASASNVEVIARKRIVRCYAMVNGAIVELGNGIVDEIEYLVNADGTVSLSVSGDDMAKELTYRSVLLLQLRSGSSPVSHSSALTSISSYAPSGWSFTAAGSPANNYIYYAFGGESVMSALIKLAEKTQTHFAFDGFRQCTFRSSAVDSGLRAVSPPGGSSSDQTCIISKLKLIKRSHDLLSRIYPYGSGAGSSRLTLAKTTRSASSPYVLDAANNIIYNSDIESQYGRIERCVQFNDVRPLSNTVADTSVAADMLFDVALYELSQRIDQFNATAYQVELLECPQILRPLQTIRIEYNDDVLDFDASLWILEATITANNQGIQTSQLVVSDQPVWVKSAADVMAESILRTLRIQSGNQLSPNQYNFRTEGTVSDWPDPGFTTYLSLNTESVRVTGIKLLFKIVAGSKPDYKCAVTVPNLFGGTSIIALNLGSAIGSSGWYELDVGSYVIGNVYLTQDVLAMTIAANTAYLPDSTTADIQGIWVITNVVQ